MTRSEGAYVTLVLIVGFVAVAFGGPWLLVGLLGGAAAWAGYESVRRENDRREALRPPEDLDYIIDFYDQEVSQ